MDRAVHASRAVSQTADGEANEPSVSSDQMPQLPKSRAVSWKERGDLAKAVQILVCIAPGPDVVKRHNAEILPLGAEFGLPKIQRQDLAETSPVGPAGHIFCYPDLCR